MRNIIKLNEKKEDIKKYCFIMMWTQLFPILIYIINGYKNVGFLEVVKNVKAGARITLIITLVMFIFMIFSPKKILKKVGVGLILFNLLVNIPDLFTYINFGTQINSDIFFIALETNKNEGLEFIKSYLNLKLLIIFLYGFFIIILLYLKRIKYFLITLGVILISILIVNFFNLEGNDYTRKYVLETLKSNYNKYQKDIEEYNRVMSSIKKFNLENEIKYSEEESTYVLVIGESSNKFHYSIYNYYRETTPNLRKLAREGEIYIFNQVITPYTHTREALQEILTLKEDKEESKFYNYPSILDLFKSAGFKTYWLSNQESYGVLGNVVSSIAKKADVVKYTEVYNEESRKLKNYDEKVIPLLDEVLNEKEKNKFIVIHLMGNHMQYQERYPSKFNCYKEIDKNFNKYQKENFEKVNYYDNSILYVDYILDKIITRVRENGKNSYVLYFSDHGEEVFDEKNFMGHSQSLTNKYMAEIPFFLWLSEDYKTNSKKLENIENSLENKYSTKDLIYTLIDLSNIKWKNFIEEKSIINPKFKEIIRKHAGEDYE